MTQQRSHRPSLLLGKLYCPAGWLLPGRACHPGYLYPPCITERGLPFPLPSLKPLGGLMTQQESHRTCNSCKAWRLGDSSVV